MASANPPREAEIDRLVSLLHETQQNLVLTHGDLDAVAQKLSGLAEATRLQLRSTETLQFSHILDAIPAHIALIDRSAKILFINRAWQRFAVANAFSGFEAGLGQNYIEICERAHGECSQEAILVAAGIRSIIMGDAPFFTLEYPCHAPDEQRWFRVMVTPLVGGGALVMHVDVTERKLKELRVAEQAALIDLVPDAVIVRTIDHRIQFWNHGAEVIFGWTAKEAIGRSAITLLDPDLAEVERATQSVIETGSWTGRRVLHHKDGRAVIAQTTMTLLRDESGQPQSILAVNTDVTDQVALSQQLAQAQKLEALGQLTGGIAHDFNNFLTIILGDAQLLADGLQENAAQLELATEMADAAQQAAELTKRLLAFSRRQPLAPRVIDPGALLQGTRVMLRRTLPESIALLMHLPNDVWNALVDPGQLESGILNLCLNARDAMINGGELAIELANVDLTEMGSPEVKDLSPGQYVLIQVHDTGAGIPPEVLEKVFDPFFTTKGSRGSGLGLSMVYGFVKQSGGQIMLNSTVGRGTTVRLYLPRAVTDERTGAVAAQAPIRGGSETILVVEDDPMVRGLTARQLRTLGYRVFPASSGPDALAILAGGADIDLMFTDVIMPGGMDGVELGAQAARMRPGLVILYTSGHIPDGTRFEALQDKPLVPKPYRRADLAQALRQLLD